MVMQKLKEMLCQELEDITKSGNLGKDTLEVAGKLLDAIKDIETIDAMGGGSSNDYSRDGYAREGYARDGYARDDYSGRRSYEYSGRRRDSMGRFARSYAGGGDQVIEELEKMLSDAPSEEREEIRRKLNDTMRRF